MLTLSILSDPLAICRLSPAEDVPEWAMIGEFVSITHTADELSIVCADEHVPPDVKADRGWRALKVEGPLDFALTGVLSSIANPLAQAWISVFALSTFDTDYVLVKEHALKQACEVLRRSGHAILTP